MGDTTGPRLELSRAQILAHRRAVGAVDRRLPAGAESLRHAAWAGLQDSMPRAALLSIHARVEATQPSTWEDPSLVQTWGPRFSAYVIAARDLPVFSLGRLPDDGPGRHRAEELAVRLRDYLDGRRLPYGEAGRGIGVHPNALRYAAALRASGQPRLLSPFVLAELDYLLVTRVSTAAESAFLAEVANGAYQLEPFDQDDVDRARSILERYADLELGLADASILVLAERHGTRDLLTLDERHFRTIVGPGGQRFRLLPADLGT